MIDQPLLDAARATVARGDAAEQQHILAIDPGNKESAYCVYSCRERKPIHFDKVANEDLRLKICVSDSDRLVIEMVQSFGMPVGREVFETVLWIGRFIECFNNGPYQLIYRSTIKTALCNSVRAKDGNIMAALIDRYGGSRRAAVGVKKAKGPLYGMAGDMWSALAIAVVAAEQLTTTNEETL